MGRYKKHIFFAFLIGLVIMNFLPINGDKNNPPTIILGVRHDLWLHLLVFAMMVMLSKWAFNLTFRKDLLKCMLLMVGFFALAAALEYAQQLVPNRNVAWDDFFWSTGGVWLGSAAFLFGAKRTSLNRTN